MIALYLASNELLVNDFVKYGVLEEMTGKPRSRVFVFKEYMMIFARKGE